MRVNITVDDALVAEFDQRAGSMRRSAFIGGLIRRGLGDERRWDDIEAASGAITYRTTNETTIPVTGFAGNAPTSVR